MIYAEDWSWETLVTYEAEIDELDGVEPPTDGRAALMAMAQEFGG